MKLPQVPGVVINADEGIVYGYKHNDPRAFETNYQGLLFKLPPTHECKNGDHIIFTAEQNIDPVSVLGN
jgi:hypothetical protein